mmetsp:Transcript_41434/g.132345  ORF Transcript_41434/g.132345 Transcript_41434/m.132345 type:complete len:258 (-) Transcript_41434:319-1092(-)
MPALAVPLAAAFPMASLAGAHRGRPILPIRPRLCPARARMMPRVRAVMDEKTKEAPNAPKEGVVGEWPAGILPPRELIPAGKLAVGGAAVYAAFTLDVTTLHLLQPFDTAVHDAVVAATTDEWRAFWARVVISDTSSILALLGTLGCLGVLAVKGGPKGWGIGALYSFLYFGFAGIIPHDDPYMMDVMKELAHRPRPNPAAVHSFSYPSGHTTAGVFTMGMLLFVLLPAALEALGKDREGLVSGPLNPRRMANGAVG